MAENTVQKATYKAEECAQILSVHVRTIYSLSIVRIHLSRF